MKKTEVLAIIPARGGSKSIPQKNIRKLAGHPLIAYSIAAGLQSKYVTRTIVSTDSEEIAGVAASYGGEVPFLRPASLAEDETPDFPVFKHVLNKLAAEEGYQPDVVIQLRPTSPLRPVDCVDAAVETLLAHPDADCVRGVVPSGQNPYKMWRPGEHGEIVSLLQDEFKEPYNMPRQKLPKTFWQTGHIDAIRIRTVLEKESLTGNCIYPLYIDPAYTVDIDTLNDWAWAEWRVQNSDLSFVRPGRAPRPVPTDVKLVVLDFDGVLTDNRVWVNQDGVEWVAANRSDGWGIRQLKTHGIDVIVLSTETNPVVTARCRKLQIEVAQGVGDKKAALEILLRERNLAEDRVVYMGNDVNDLSVYPLVGCFFAPTDAHPEVLLQADLVVSEKGGRGAVRELADMLLANMKREVQEWPKR
ncbi:MAG: acylneuraminate cytidylyltransferase [Anaerolineales bacterium]|nr:acylneuraminate cytidylyltransferase [Anaerolineales bacterium]